MTAFSPPPESWIIRYPKSKELQQQPQPTTTMKDHKKGVPEARQLEDPCRQYIESSEIHVKSNKSLGTDDHFKSAVCSRNLLKVCEKLMIKKQFVAATVIDGSDDDFEELSLMNENSRAEYYRKKHGGRRPSQSLPVSPKLERKNPPTAAASSNVNPYFTVTKQPLESQSNLGFLTSLFGITAAKPAEALANLAQKQEFDANFGGGAEASAAAPPRNRQMTPKPNEYRELNLFSPTSM